jgi:ribulose bisphosphate carboxylase small subunit
VAQQGRSAVLTLLLIAALQDAAAMEEALGDRAIAARYREQAQLAGAAVYSSCWNPQLGLLADTPDKKEYSQHANALAVLTDVIPTKDQGRLMQKILDSKDPDLARASYVFQFYITRALDHAGVGDLYQQTLAPWRQMLAQGLTTTPEYADPTRSDTHAWSAHPAYDLGTMIAGIRPGAPGFGTVRIQPSLGELEWVEASMPHPAGMITTSFHRNGNSVKATIELPPGIRGVLLWKGRAYDLRGGRQEFDLPLPPPADSAKYSLNTRTVLFLFERT